MEPGPVKFEIPFAPAVPCQYRSVAIYRKLKFSSRKIVFKVQQTLQFTSCAFVRGFGLFFLFNLLRHLRYVFLGLRSLIYVSGCTFFRSLITPPQFHDSLPAVNIVTFSNFMLLLVYYVVCF